MKKNWTMRVGALMLALTLITSCFVGGTFAKYVTAGEGSDYARVAKFGVVIDVAGSSMFDDEYKTHDDDYKGAVSVKSNNGDNVVAPGTSSEDTNAVKFAISGTPEVAVRVDVDFNVNKDVFLKAGTYTDWTHAPYNTAFTQAEDYYPVVFTLTQTRDANGPIANPTPVATGSLSKIQEALDAYTGAEYAPKTDLAAEFELSWAWDFDDEGKGTNDKADTMLGNLAAGNVDGNFNWANDTFAGALTYGEDYSTEIDYDLTITVTQID